MRPVSWTTLPWPPAQLNIYTCIYYIYDIIIPTHEARRLKMWLTEAASYWYLDHRPEISWAHPSTGHHSTTGVHWQDTDSMPCSVFLATPILLDMRWIYVAWIWNSNQIQEKCVLGTSNNDPFIYSDIHGFVVSYSSGHAGHLHREWGVHCILAT